MKGQGNRRETRTELPGGSKGTSKVYNEQIPSKINNNVFVKCCYVHF